MMIQRRRNRLVIDAGALALSKDRSTVNLTFDATYGLVCDLNGRIFDDLVVSEVSQEIGIIISQSGNTIDFDRHQIGDKVRILPNHADMTAAAHERYYVVNDDIFVSEVGGVRTIGSNSFNQRLLQFSIKRRRK